MCSLSTGTRCVKHVYNIGILGDTGPRYSATQEYMIVYCLSLSSSSLSLRKSPVQGHSPQRKSRFRSVREALMGSSGCEGRLERPPSVEEIVIRYVWSVQFEHQQDRQEVFQQDLLK